MRRLMRWRGWVETAVIVFIAAGAQAQTPAPSAAPVFLTHPGVTDTAHLKGDAVVVTLGGVQGWAGDPARDLQGLIAQDGDKVTCQPHADGTYACTLPTGADLGQLAVAVGDAKALDDAPEAYKTGQTAAKAAGRGLWAGVLPAGADLLHPLVTTTAELAADGRVYMLDGLIGFGARFYTLQLQSYIDAHGGQLRCEPKGGGRYVCRLPDGTDIATVALLRGLARAEAKSPPDYRADQAEAVRARTGFWLNPPEPLLAALPPAPEPAPQVGCCVTPPSNLEPELSFDGDIPVVVIEGEPVPFVFIKEIGWGFYDHLGQWHGAPERVRAELAGTYPNGPPLAPVEGRLGGGRALAGNASGFITPPETFRAAGLGRVSPQAQPSVLASPGLLRAPTFRPHPITPIGVARPGPGAIALARPAPVRTGGGVPFVIGRH